MGPASRAPGEILVKFRDAADADDVDSQGTISSGRRPGLAALLARHELREGRKLFPRTTYRRLNRLVKMSSARLRREPQRLHEILAALRARPEVEYAEPNVTLQALWAPNDPYYGSSGAWGQAFGDLWGLQKIVASLAWDRSKGAGVVVAVLDTGVDATHPDLAANLWQSPGETGLDGFGRDKRTNGVDDDGNGFVDDWRGWDFTLPGGGYNAPVDYHGHGTHVAGTIAAVGNNAVGVIGVAPLARVMPVKVLDSGGSGTLEEISNGILYAADNGARVINASLGGLGETPQTLEDAIAYAHDVKGVVFVAAAGNSNTDVGPAWTGFFPANIRDAIAVAAFDHVDQKASFSNFGAKIDVAAPGGGDTDASGTIYEAQRSILSLKAAYAGSAMTGSGQLVVGGQYLRQAGTSMAAPHVAGVAALVLALHPEYSPEQVRQAIRRGADDVGAAGFDTLSGWGRLNADRATSAGPLLGVQLTDPARPFPATLPPSVRGSAAGPGLLDWTLAFGGGTTPVGWTPIATGTAAVTNATLADWPTSSLLDGTYTLRLTARNTTGQTYEDRMQVAIDSLVITSPAPETITPYRAGQTVSIRGTVAPAGFTSYWMTVQGARSGQLPNPQITLANGGLQPVVNGPLGSWNTTGVPADHYQVCVWNSGPPYAPECTRVLVDPALHPGWPRNLGSFGSGGLWYAIVDHLTAADLDGNGTQDLLIAYGSSVRVIGADGGDLPGWPQTIDPTGTDAIIQQGPAVGDLTGDGVPEVAALTNQGNVFAWNADGTLLPGWPRKLANIFGHVAIDDLDGDGRNEIIVAGDSILVVDANGIALPGWPRRPGPSLLGAPAIGDLDGDGRKEIVVQGIAGPSPIFAYRADGSPLPGWPQNLNPSLGTSYQAHSEPVLGDLDGDGAAEIVAGSSDGKVYAFRFDGSQLAGWPRLARPAAVNTPAIGDIDGDGVPEVIAGTDRSSADYYSTNALFAWHADGTPLPGWPVQVSGISSSYFGYGAPALADLDGDGKSDVIVSSDASYYTPFALNAYRFNGAKLGDFPRPTLGLGAWPSNSVALADLDADGMLEMAWIDDEANLFVWDLQAPAEAKAPWPMFRHDAAHTGSVTPSQLRLNLGVKGVAGGKGTVHQPGASCDNLAGPDATCVYAFEPGATVTLSVAPAAGDLFLGWGGACSGTGVTCLVTLSDYRSVTATFRPSNLAPTASPGGPYGGYRNVPVTFDGTASSDPDGDPLTYQWSFGDGATGTGATPTHAYASLGTYAVSLVVSDAALSSAAVSTTVTIVNRAPVANPGGPYVGNNATGLVVAFDGSASYDPDGDPLTAYNWSFGDGTIGSGPTPTHAYPGEGYYPASLSVSDGLTTSPPVTVGVGILDVIPPTPVTDLAAVGLGSQNVRLTWTATGGNGTSGTAALYDLRYSTSPIDASNFLTATQAVGEPTPKAAGAAESFTVASLTPGTPYYFALDVLDAASNHSGLSNVATGSPTPVVTIFSDTMEAGPANWVVTGSDGVGGPALWHLSSHRAASPTRAYYYGVESTLTYNTGARNQGSLSSIPINLGGAQGSRLAFKYFLQKESSSSYDIARVYVSNNGGASWTQLGSALAMVGSFTEASFSLSAYDGQTVRVRFDFDTVDSALNGYEGFLVDDVVVTADSRVPVPTARPGGPYSGFKRQPIAFDGSTSSDPGGATLDYSWSFGDGTTGTGATPTHAYQASGTFTVTLVVSNGTTSSSPASTTTVVTNRAPTAVVGGPYAGPRGAPVVFDGSGSSDPDGDSLTYSWSFGDAATGSGVAPSHIYSTPGTYNVSLTVSDGSATSPASATTAAIVDVTPPAAVTNLAASAPDGRRAILSWTATGNDGTAGSAALYDLRYSIAPIDALNFAAAIAVAAPAPKAAGGAESVTVSGLQPKTTYYFALEARDAAGNWSELSNVATVTTLAEFSVYLDDVETLGAGWAIAGTNGVGGAALWHVTTHRVASPSHAFYYGIDATHTYNSGATNYGTLTSPPISLAGAGNVTLALQYFLQKESSASYDKASIQVSKDAGLSWTLLATPAATASMVPLYVSLAAYDGQTIQIRFAFDTVDSVANGYEGWVIDDIRVVAASLVRQLSLSVSGVDSGTGSVVMSPPEVDCDNSASGGAPVVCQQAYEAGSVVTLTAAPAPDSVFGGWTGACSGTQATCSVTVSSDLAVGAAFRGPQTLMLTVDSLEQGSGSVHVSPPDTDCANAPGSPQTCSTLHQVGSVLTLTPLPSPDSVFAGWSGACSGSEPCQVTMDEARVAIAVFRGPQTLMLTVDSLEQGSGTVHVSPPGADCANTPGSPHTCSTLHQVGTVLMLTPLPSPDSVFAGWSGACSGTEPCQLTMTAARVVVAVFRIANHPPTANAGGPYAGTRLQAVSFSGAASSDPDGDALSYAWDFGDGGTAPGVAPTHHYAGVGTFTVTLTVNDGTVPSAPVATTVQIANVEPSVRLIGPADGSVFTLPAIVSVMAEASDLDGSIGRVEFYAGATLIGVDPTAPYEAAWSGAPAGVYLLTARAVDSDGKAVTSATVSVLLNSPASVALVAPSDGAQFAAGSTIALGATGADVDGVVTQVEFFAGATSLGVDTSSPYTAELVGAPVGVYSLTARATDDRGAVVSSPAITVRVTASLAPAADAEVRGSNPNTNYGAASTLAVQQGSSASNQRWSYLKLDLSTVPSVSNAKLRVFGAVNATTSTVIQMAAYPVSDTGWSETGLRWNNKPASGATPLSSVTIVSSSTTGRWYELDVTMYLAQEKAAGRNVVTLVLKNLANSTRYVSLSSRQAATNRPELLVVP